MTCGRSKCQTPPAWRVFVSSMAISQQYRMGIFVLENAWPMYPTSATLVRYRKSRSVFGSPVDVGDAGLAASDSVNERSSDPLRCGFLLLAKRYLCAVVCQQGDGVLAGCRWRLLLDGRRR